MKRVTYREVIHIDGTDYTIGSLDYTASIEQAIKDEACGDNNHDIIDWILDDIRTNPWLKIKSLSLLFITDFFLS